MATNKIEKRGRKFIDADERQMPIRFFRKKKEVKQLGGEEKLKEKVHAFIDRELKKIK